MSTFSYTADFFAQKKTKPEVLQVRFGDGYEQRQAFGINTQMTTWTLTFKMRENSEADAIEAFLIARGAVEAFDWTEPYGSTAERWVCREWTRTVEKATRSTISCTFEKVFEPSV